MAILQSLVLSKLKDIKEVTDNTSKFSIEQYMQLPIWDIQHTSEWTEKYTSREGMKGSRKLEELETPDILAKQEGYSIVLSPERFGGAVIVSETAYTSATDTTTSVDSFIAAERNELLNDNKYDFAVALHQFFNEAFDSTSELLAPDGVELCGVHKWKTPGAATWDNSTTATFSETSFQAALEYGTAFKMGSGKLQAQTFDTIVCYQNSATAILARKLFVAQGMVPTKIDDINIYEGSTRIIELPLIKPENKNYWFLFDLKQRKSPLYVGITEFPTMREPIRESNEAVRTNCTGFYKKGIKEMPFNVYGGGKA